MSDDTSVKATESGPAQRIRETGPSLRPPVDVFENENGIILHADLPGVGSEGLNLQIDKDTLLIEGRAELPFPEGMKAMYAEVRAANYRRSFAMSSELDTNAVQASLKDGVLTLRIPKKEALQPRKIEVQAV